MKKVAAVLGSVALTLLIATGAFAAKGLLTGAEIKNGSLAGLDVKKGSLTAGDRSASAQAALRGHNSLNGKSGAKGATFLVPMVAQANSQSAHSDGPISYDTQHEATLPSGIQVGPVSKQLWYTDHYNAVASALAGFAIEADGEDDYAEWGSWLDDPYAVLGFTSIYASASSPLYHRIFLAPPIWSTLLEIDSGGIDSVSRADAAEAILTLTHEAYHQRLYSADESRVNACALRDFGWVLVNEFGVSQTTQQTVTSPKTSYVRVRHAVWRISKGKRVRRYVYRFVRKTTYTSHTLTVINPGYSALVSAAEAFVASQPPPYNSGTCT